jgi:hypothetical protein
MDSGVEVKRRWYQIYADRVPERRLNRYRLSGMMDHDPKGLKAGEKLEDAEQYLIRSVMDYLAKGANEELVMRAVRIGIDWSKETKQA